MSEIAKTPKPPYYVVIFTSIRTNVEDGYSETNDKITELAKQQEGFLGMESARAGLGISAIYWRDLESIQRWRNNEDHQLAKVRGIKDWYAAYHIRIAKVEREYGFVKAT